MAELDSNSIGMRIHMRSTFEKCLPERRYVAAQLLFRCDMKVGKKFCNR